ncbi:Type 1 phosphatases regulator ypi1 [Stygiomarasmius scandens]|uniref:Type 1 phosphatases regulator n=1 Tax=Marasmiellus scandens TaxID=2682957 RepID=A0ABR1J8X9_9AGAR
MSMSSTRRRPNTSAPGDGSRTITITGTPADEQHGDDAPEGQNGESSSGVVGTLKLHGGKKNRQRVVWSDDVVDNEDCGRKSSKICCIYHKPKPFDESSDEEDSDSDSDSDCGHGHSHSHRHSHGHGDEGSGGTGVQSRDGGSGVVHSLEESSDSDVNAYEAAPKSGKGKRKA